MARSNVVEMHAPQTIAEIAVALSKRNGLLAFFPMRDALQKLAAIAQKAAESDPDSDITITLTRK